MSVTLDIVPLRSLVAVADSGGFHRAAATLHLTQAAVSRHVQRLEHLTGRKLIERRGRGIRFTEEGERFLCDARLILDTHDAAVDRLGLARPRTLTVAAMDHAADTVLPSLANDLAARLPGWELRFTVGRSAALRADVRSGEIDVAIAFDGLTPDAADTTVPLAWTTAADWTPPPGPVPLVLFNDDCSLRQAVIQALTVHHIPFQVAAESTDLTGVLAATRSGLGITALPTLGTRPHQLVHLTDLPPLPHAILTVRTRPGLDPATADLATDTIRRHLHPVN